MSQAVFQKVIRRFTNTYGAPNVPDPEALTEEFCRALKGYSETILDLGVSRVIQEHVFPTWPTVGQVVIACRKVAEQRNPPRIDPPDPPPVFDPDAAARVQNLVADFRMKMQDMDDELRGPVIDVSRAAFEARAEQGKSRFKP